MSQINSNTKDDFQVVLLLSCFVGHPALKQSEPPEYVTYGPTCNLKYVAILICNLQNVL